jgi:hypothetical protein
MIPSSIKQPIRRLTLSALSLIALASFTWAQGNGAQSARCVLTLAQAPELRAFRLGLNQDRVVARFPGLSFERPDEFGLTKVKLIMMGHEAYPGGTVGRDRAVQMVTAASTADGRSFLVDSSKYPDLKGVNGIRLRFVDGRISYLQVGYDESVDWNDVDEFVHAISKPLGLSESWQRGADSEASTREKELPCDGFRVTASLGGTADDFHIGAQLALDDLAASKLVEKRQSDQIEKKKRQEEERRRTFKP